MKEDTTVAISVGMMEEAMTADLGVGISEVVVRVDIMGEEEVTTEEEAEDTMVVTPLMAVVVSHCF